MNKTAQTGKLSQPMLDALEEIGWYRPFTGRPQTIKALQTRGYVDVVGEGEYELTEPGRANFRMYFGGDDVPAPKGDDLIVGGHSHTPMKEASRVGAKPTIANSATQASATRPASATPPRPCTPAYVASPSAIEAAPISPSPATTRTARPGLRPRRVSPRAVRICSSARSPQCRPSTESASASARRRR